MDCPVLGVAHPYTFCGFLGPPICRAEQELIEIKKLPRIPPRRPDTHKGDYGRALIIAGSTGMTGAAALAALSCLRSGAGLVTLGIPASLNSILEVKLTSAMTHPFPDTGHGTFASSAKDEILKFAQDFDIIAIGPGLGREEETIHLVLELLAELDKPLVIDADALYAIAQDMSVLGKIKKKAVLSPHPGEMSRLTGKSTSEIQKSRLETAASFAREHKVILVLKGHRTIITDGAKFYINPTGNPGMATAGSGDVLTGAIAAFLAQGHPPFDAAELGVYIHGLAGDLAAEEKGEISLIAEDILDKLPQATMRISQP